MARHPLRYVKPLLAALLIPAMVAAPAGAQPASPPPQAPAGPTTQNQGSNDAPQVQRLLEETIAGKHPIQNVRIAVTMGQRVTVYGKGVGVLDGRKQFSLEREQVLAMLKQLHDAKFTAMPKTVGGRKLPVRAGAPMRVLATVELHFGIRESAGVGNVVRVVGEGPDAEAVTKLAKSLLEVATKAADEGGILAENLDDGLKKIKAGKLDPVAMRVTFASRSRGGNPGWIVRIEHGVTIAQRREGSRLGESRVLPLDQKQAAELAGTLLENGLSKLPSQVYGPGLSDLRVTVLNRSNGVQARDNFARIKSDTEPEQQKAFRKIADSLSRLAERVVKEGHKEKLVLSPAAATGKIVGKVVDAKGNPVAGAEVSVLSPSNKGRKVTERIVNPDGSVSIRTSPENTFRGKTNAAGQFELTLPPARDYVVNVYHEAGGAGAQSLIVEAGKTTDAGTFELQRGEM